MSILFVYLEQEVRILFKIEFYLLGKLEVYKHSCY